MSQILKEADRRINYDIEEFEDEDYVEDVGDREYFNVHDSGDGFSKDVMDVQQDKRTQVVFKNTHISKHFLIAPCIKICKRQALRSTATLFCSVQKQPAG